MEETVTANKAVGISYTLKSDEGSLIDTASSDAPMWYIQGLGSLLPAVESALEGQTVGGSVQLALAPVDGYGLRDERMLMQVPREAFPPELEIKEGMSFMIEAEGDVGARPWTAMRVEDGAVTLDGNHPLAGVPLHFDITVEALRDASAEELASGQVVDPNAPSYSCC